MAAAVAQDYPRISEGEEFAGLLDERKLTPHTYKIPQSKLRQIIAHAVKSANRKAGRAILNIPEKSTDAEMRKICLDGSENKPCCPRMSLAPHLLVKTKVIQPSFRLIYPNFLFVFFA